MEITDLLAQVIIATIRSEHDASPEVLAARAVRMADAVRQELAHHLDLLTSPHPEAPGALTHLAVLEEVNRQLRESAANNATANDALRAEVKTLREELAREKAASSGVAGRLALVLYSFGGRRVITAADNDALAGRTWAIQDEATGEPGTRVLSLRFTDEPQPAAPSPEEIPS